MTIFRLTYIFFITLKAGNDKVEIPYEMNGIEGNKNERVSNKLKLACGSWEIQEFPSILKSHELIFLPPQIQGNPISLNINKTLH